MSTPVDKLLYRLRLELKSLLMAYPEPLDAAKIAAEYKNTFEEDINFKQFGYGTVENLLIDHPDLEKLSFGGRCLFKAQVSMETEDLQKMIACQKKKKKKKKGSKGNMAFARSSRGYRSFAPNSKVPPINFARSSLRISSLTKQNAIPLMRSSASPIRPLNTPCVSVPNIPLGRERVFTVLKSCDGRTTLTKFDVKYTSMYGTSFNKAEVYSLFGSRSLFSVINEYFANEIILQQTPNNWLLISADIFKKQQEWEATHKFVVVKDAITWDKPSIARLFQNVVHLLCEMYPNTLTIENMSEMYKRFYSMNIDPVELYAKSWERLVTGVFSSKLELCGNEVRLQKEIILVKKLHLRRASVCKVQQTVQSDLLESYDDEEDEDSFGSDVESLASSFSMSSRASRPSSVATENTECLNHDFNDRDSTAGFGFGFGRLSSLRKSMNSRAETIHRINNDSDKKCSEDTNKNPTPIKRHIEPEEPASLNISEVKNNPPRKGHGFGFRAIAKALAAFTTDSKDKTKTETTSSAENKILENVDTKNRSSMQNSNFLSNPYFNVKIVGKPYQFTRK